LALRQILPIMKKLNLSLKRLFLSGQPQQWPNYLVLAGFCLKFIVAPHVPVALAQVEQSSGSDYSLMAVEAVQSPSLMQTQSGVSNYSFVLAGNFVQPNISAFSVNDLLEAKPLQKSQKVIASASNTKRVTVTAYSSTLDQTDGTPFISANGTHVYDGMIACNFLPFGTKVRFPEIYGDKVFTVEDRMAWYNGHKIDIWMTDRQSALEFGVKKLAYEIVK